MNTRDDYPAPSLVVSNEAPVSTAKAPQTRLEQVQYALLCARTARDWLRRAGALKAAEYQSRAIKSIEGAERHADRIQER